MEPVVGRAAVADSVALWGWNLTTVPISGYSVTEWLAGIAALASTLGFVVAGSYLAFRLPHNAVGWVMAGYGLIFTLLVMAEDVVRANLTSGPIREWLAWSGTWTWAVAGVLLTVFLPLLFPDGRLPSRRWRWLVWTVTAPTVPIFGANAFHPDATAPVRNPLGLPALRDALDLAGLVGFVLYAGCIVGAVVAVVGRFRRSRGVARRQMLVFAASAAVVAVGIGAGYTFYEIGQGEAANLAIAGVSLIVPVAVGMAVLKYRLYDLGRLFKRTVTYSAVALILLGVYLAGILTLQAVVGADDSLSVAASTLAAAALFNPVRVRVRAFVNRRFDRASYDASLEVAEFSVRLSQEIDLDQLNSDLTRVVDRTLRPAGLSVWVRNQPG